MTTTRKIENESDVRIEQGQTISIVLIAEHDMVDLRMDGKSVVCAQVRRRWDHPNQPDLVEPGWMRLGDIIDALNRTIHRE